MTREQARLWAVALESGKWEQAHGALQEYDKRCCLGVASDIWHPEINWTYPVKELTDREIDKFVELNDKKCLTFPQIAAYIRETYLADEDKWAEDRCVALTGEPEPTHIYRVDDFMALKE